MFSVNGMRKIMNGELFFFHRYLVINLFNGNLYFRIFRL